MDELAPIAATVAVDRRAPVKSSRSTLATMADLEPYLAGLFGREAIPTCPDCGARRGRHVAPRRGAARLAESHEGARAIVTYAVARRRRRAVPRGARAAREGRLPPAGRRRRRPRDRRGAAERGHGPGRARRGRRRSRDACARATRGACRRRSRPRGRTATAAPSCGSTPSAERRDVARSPSPRARLPEVRAAFEPPRPGLFSYNSPFGACDACRGFGRIIAVDWDKVIPDPNKSLKAGAIKPWSGAEHDVGARRSSRSSARRGEIPLDVPWEELTRGAARARHRRRGRRGRGASTPACARGSPGSRRARTRCTCACCSRATASTPLCTACDGSRLNATALAYRVAGLNLAAWHALTVTEALARVRALRGARSAGQARAGAARVAPRLPRRRRARIPHARPAGAHALGRRGAARGAHDGARRGAHRARSSCSTSRPWACTRPTCPRSSRVMRELARGGNACSSSSTSRSSCARATASLEMGPGAGPTAGASSSTDAGASSRSAPTCRPAAPGAARRTRARRARARRRMARGARRARAQPRERRRARPARRPLRGHRAERLGQVDARRTTSLYRAARARPRRTSRSTGPASTTRSRGSGTCARAVLVDQSPLGRTARGNAGDVREGVGPHPRALRRGARGGAARAHGRALLVQRARGPLRGVLGRGLRDRRDAVPRRRAAPLPGVPGQALQARGARGHAPRQDRSPTCSR